MPLARAISRGAFLKARFGVNGIQNGSRSLGTAVATASLLAWGMAASRMDFGRAAPGACPGIAAAAERRTPRAGCGTRPPVAGGSHFAPTKPHCAPSPSRTRVFPSSAIDNWSKSETSEVDMGEGWGEGYLFDSADRHPPPGSRAESARHSDASHRVLSRTAAEGRLCLPHKGGGNRSERLRLPSARGDDIPAPGPSERAMNKAKDKGVKARLPRGFADRAAAEIFATRRMLERIREVFERYGFESVETPAIEYTDVLRKFLPDQDRPGEGVFSFQDDDEQWLSLRYDLTAPLARYVAENFEKLPRPSEPPPAAPGSAGCPARRGGARAAPGSSCSSPPTRSAPPRWPPTP